MQKLCFKEDNRTRLDNPHMECEELRTLIKKNHLYLPLIKVINIICVYLNRLRYEVRSSVNLTHLLTINKRKEKKNHHLHESSSENSHRNGLYSVSKCVCAIPVS